MNLQGTRTYDRTSLLELVMNFAIRRRHQLPRTATLGLYSLSLAVAVGVSTEWPHFQYLLSVTAVQVEQSVRYVGLSVADNNFATKFPLI